MITASHIQELLSAKPFRPFTLNQGVDGSFTVDDPAHARLTHEILILTIPGRKLPANPKFRFPAHLEEDFARQQEYHISLAHVRHLSLKTERSKQS